jgi:hypothetical protein
VFGNYIKETGPWRNAWVSDGGPDLVTVKFDAALLAVELLVSWRMSLCFCGNI